MNILRKLYIFEELPGIPRIPVLQHTSSPANWWKIVSTIQGKLVPPAFVSILLLTSDISLISVAFLIVFLNHSSAPVIIGTDLVFLCSYTILLFSRGQKRLSTVLSLYVVAILLALLLNVVFPGQWGSVLFYVLGVNLFYRLPLRLSLPLALCCLLTLLLSEGAWRLLLTHQAVNIGLLAFSTGLSTMLAWFGWTRRVEYRLVVQLHEVQEQLREQMKRSEELATERERTRIARDIHDVLSHSLAVLSIQVQAARQLVARDPERLTSKLDDMAALIRESITESRRVVGLLRAQPISGQDDMSVHLQTIATTFNERTGISCRFDESGTPHALTQQQQETLQQALRETLTNAHRHGAAQTVWITLRWREANVVLELRDDGLGAKAGDLFADLTGNDVGGHHGIQGIRERVGTLGGEVEAGPLDTGGFLVTLRIPYKEFSYA